jgi:hypothetical protein
VVWPLNLDILLDCLNSGNGSAPLDREPGSYRIDGYFYDGDVKRCAWR